MSRSSLVVAEHDMQVPPEDGEAICALVAGPCQEVIVPGFSHILRDDPDSKRPRGYRKALKAPVSPAALTAMSVRMPSGVLLIEMRG